MREKESIEGTLIAVALLPQKAALLLLWHCVAEAPLDEAATRLGISSADAACWILLLRQELQGEVGDLEDLPPQALN